MPDTDFSAAMMAPSNPAWADPSAFGVSGWGQTPQSGGVYSWRQPPVAPGFRESWGSTFSGLGNIGSGLSSLLDRTSPLENWGLTRPPDWTSGSQGFLARSARQAQQQLRELQDRDSADRVRATLVGAGFRSDWSETVGKASVNMGIGGSFLYGGDLSDSGISSLYRAGSTYSNLGRPAFQDVNRLRQVFQGYFGFRPGQTVDVSRTMGRSQDELASVTDYLAHFMSPEARSAAMAQGSADFKDFYSNGLGTAFAGVAGVSQTAAAAAIAGGGSVDDVVSRLSKATGASIPLLSSAAAKASMARFGVGYDMLDETAAQTSAVMRRGMPDALKTLNIAEDAGFSGSIQDFQKDLEEHFQDEALSPAKAASIADRLRTITRSTGMTLEAAASFMTTVKNASGLFMGADTAATIATFSSMVGNVEGMTERQRQQAKATVAQANIEALQSPAGIFETMMSLTGGADAEQYMLLLHSDSPTDRARADAMRVGMIANPGSAADPAQRAVLAALSIGDTRTANGLTQDLLEGTKARLADYNSLVAGGNTSAGDLAERRRVLRMRGATFGADGRGVLSEGMLTNLHGAGMAALREIDVANPRIRASLVAAGRKWSANGKITDDEAARLGGILMDTRNQNGGVLSPGLAVAKDLARQQGLDVRDDILADALIGDLGNASSLGARNASALAYSYRHLATMGMSETVFDVNQRKVRDQNALGILAGVGGALASIAGASAQPMNDALMASLGVSRDAPEALKDVLGSVASIGDDTKRKRAIELYTKIMSDTQGDRGVAPGSAADTEFQKRLQSEEMEFGKLTGTGGGALTKLLTAMSDGKDPMGWVDNLARVLAKAPTTDSMKLTGDLTIHLDKNGQVDTSKPATLNGTTTAQPSGGNNPGPKSN